MSQGFAEDAKTAKLISAYRQRNVRYWNSKTPDGTARPPGPHAPGTGDDEDDAAVDSEAAAAIAALAREASRFDETAQDAAKLARAQASSRTVDDLLLAYDSAVGVRVPVRDAPIAPADDATAIYVDGVNNDWLAPDNDEPDEIRPSGFAEDDQPFEWPDGSHLSPSQLLASEAIRQYLPGTDAPPTPFLVCGGPGAGKTFVAQYLAACCEGLGYKARSSALASSAAGLLPGGCTLHTLIGLGGRRTAGKKGGGSVPVDFSKPIPADKLHKLRKKFSGTLLLIIDEISMVPVDLLGHVNHRLQVVMQNSSLFGGLVVVLMGDFDQLPPVMGISLAAQLMHISCAGDTLHAASAAASSLTAFKAARAFFLTEQMRCSDGAWQAMLDRCRATGTLAPMAGVIKKLSLADCTCDGLWRSATVATFGNRVRQCINYRQAVGFARATGRPVVKWKHLVQKGTAVGSDDERLFGTFVVGAPAYLTKNISAEATELGIHNGTRCKLHAIGYSTSARQQTFNDAIAAGGHGEDVWVDPPDFIVVDIGPRPGLASAPRTAEGNILLTLAPGETDEINVIATSVPADADGMALAPRAHLSSVTVQTFDVDLEWSLTYAKLQGATLERLVVDFTHYDVPPHATFELILVALSRVRTGDGLRYMGTEEDVAKLLCLNVNPLTRSWRAGFATNGSLWDRDLAVQHYDANGGGVVGGRGKKRSRGRGGAASASSGARSAAAGGGAAAAVGRGGGGEARGSRGGARGSRGGARGSRGRGASGGGGDAADPAPAAAGVGRIPLTSAELRVLQDAQPASPPPRGASGAQ
jgi:hypothetical protein